MKIKKGKEIPERNYPRKYPFNEMEVDEYIEFDDPEEGKAAYQAASMYAHRHGVKFTMRSYEEGRVIIWRIK